MKDRVPANPGRVLITPENGAAAYYATMTRADNPTQVGDPLNKNTLLKDATAALYGLGASAVPDDALRLLSRLHAGLGNEYVWERQTSKMVPVTISAVTTVATFNTNLNENIVYKYGDSYGVNADGTVYINNPSSVTMTKNSTGDDWNVFRGKWVTKDIEGIEFVQYFSEDATIARKLTSPYYHFNVTSGSVTEYFRFKEEYEGVGFVNSPNANAYPINDGYTYTPLGMLGEKIRIETGSYTGTGSYGSAAGRNSLTLPFEPKVLLVGGGNTQRSAYLINPWTRSSSKEINSGTANMLEVTWNGTTVLWKNDNTADGQLNYSGRTYYYVAIG